MKNSQSKTLDGWGKFVSENKLHPVEWKETVIPLREDKKCDHYFEFVGGQASCTKCPLRLFGVIQIKDGKPIV